MNQAKKLSGIALASAAAALLMAGNASAGSHGAADATIKCSGVNSCKGTGACGTATHACAGQNACKGQGWVKMTAEECAEKGGTEYVPAS